MCKRTSNEMMGKTSNLIHPLARIHYTSTHYKECFCSLLQGEKTLTMSVIRLTL